MTAGSLGLPGLVALAVWVVVLAVGWVAWKRLAVRKNRRRIARLAGGGQVRLAAALSLDGALFRDGHVTLAGAQVTFVSRWRRTPTSLVGFTTQSYREQALVEIGRFSAELWCVLECQTADGMPVRLMVQRHQLGVYATALGVQRWPVDDFG